MTPQELRQILERHQSLLSELRDVHLGKALAGDVDPASREQQLGKSLEAISAEVAEHQFTEQQQAETQDNALRMTDLALTFPSLSVNTPGLVPWDQSKLDDWVQSGGPSSGERASGEFLLYVWNPFDDSPWAGRFNLADTMKSWDIFHQFAFLKWAENPFWP